MDISALRAVLRRALEALGFGMRGSRTDRQGGAYQVAALPVRVTRAGTLKVLLISTRGSADKLIIPRGWPMPGTADFQAARIEAAEEAGVSGPISLHPIGAYRYRSDRKAKGRPIRVDVYRMDVVRAVPDFKERGERRREWLGVDEAARRVNEPDLGTIIAGLRR